MKVVITIEDAEDGHVKVSELRIPGEEESAVTSATALADAMFEVMDRLGETEGTAVR